MRKLLAVVIIGTVLFWLNRDGSSGVMEQSSHAHPHVHSEAVTHQHEHGKDGVTHSHFHQH